MLCFKTHLFHDLEEHQINLWFLLLPSTNWLSLVEKQLYCQVLERRSFWAVNNSKYFSILGSKTWFFRTIKTFNAKSDSHLQVDTPGPLLPPPWHQWRNNPNRSCPQHSCICSARFCTFKSYCACECTCTPLNIQMYNNTYLYVFIYINMCSVYIYIYSIYCQYTKTGTYVWLMHFRNLIAQKIAGQIISLGIMPSQNLVVPYLSWISSGYWRCKNKYNFTFPRLEFLDAPKWNRWFRVSVGIGRALYQLKDANSKLLMNRGKCQQ